MSSKDPKWYQRLSRKNRNRVDQAIHGVLGFLGAFIFVDRLGSWYREFVSQLPIERIADTKEDLLSYAIGGTLGDIVRTLLIIWGMYEWMGTAAPAL